MAILLLPSFKKLRTGKIVSLSFIITMVSERCNQTFEQVVDDYHQHNIYHIARASRTNQYDEALLEKNRAKLAVLSQQQEYLSLAINELLEDIEKGNRYIKVYRQIKMYNDPELNPVLYSKINGRYE